jgi:hypothetical protein
MGAVGYIVKLSRSSPDIPPCRETHATNLDAVHVRYPHLTIHDDDGDGEADPILIIAATYEGPGRIDRAGANEQRGGKSRARGLWRRGTGARDGRRNQSLLYICLGSDASIGAFRVAPGD